MPAGLIAWDAQGRQILNLTDRLSRIIGDVNTGTSNGSISVPGFSTGDRFVIVLPVTGITLPPAVLSSGTTLAWSFDSIPAEYRRACTIFYGVY
ncbi:hypothetical protein [Stenotrophomonas tuberculopleuritidis]|uniref:hypothetical protein n=1 Tax=Stenotrophomonas tuberculopleuritidis TaxID=3055079 RepID=UPI0026E52A08|nr:hypothetical protein [Stenotrophomonas sp. 704A1]